MNNKEFPTVCVDYFYKDPEEVRKLASTVDYEPSPDGKYPGKRTRPLIHLPQSSTITL